MNSILSYLPAIIPSIIAISVHEMCHGLAAYWLGDETARSQNRISLNPLRHIDPIGFLMLVIFHFGWAKPVPFDPRYFKNPKRDIAITAFAGPLSNFLVAFLGAFVLIGADVRTINMAPWIVTFFTSLVSVNLGLCVFNLLPIPPLDGSKVLFSILPEHIYYKILNYERFGMLFIIIAINSNIFDPVTESMYTSALTVIINICSFILRV